MSSACRRRSVLGWLAAAPLATPRAWAESQPIRVIVPFHPGTAPDLLARWTLERVAESTHRTVVVDNRGGAGGSLGAALAARSTPDGQTFLLGSAGTHGINPSIYDKLAYDPEKDFLPVTGVAQAANVLVVAPESEFTTVDALVARAKAQPGRLLFGHTGIGTTPHLAGALLHHMAGMQVTSVPLPGTTLLDVVGRRVDYAMDSIAVVPHVRSQRVRALAVTSLKRVPVLPDVPTLDELGFSGYEVTAWSALFAPAHTPRAPIDRLQAAVQAALAEPDLIRRFLDTGATPLRDGAAQLAARVHAELQRWPAIVKGLNAGAG